MYTKKLLALSPNEASLHVFVNRNKIKSSFESKLSSDFCFVKRLQTYGELVNTYIYPITWMIID